MKGKFSKAQHRKSEIIYVDESGTSGVKSHKHNLEHPYFVIGFCYCKNPRILNRKCRKLLTKLQKDDLYPKKMKEIKFHPTSALQFHKYDDNEIQSYWEPHYDTVRKELLNVILKYADGVFAGIVDKRQLSKDMISEQVGNDLFEKSLKHVLDKLHFSAPPLIIYDRGRLGQKRAAIFDKHMQDTISKIIHKDESVILHSNTFNDSDSTDTPGIWTSDFVAGAFHLAIKHNRTEYWDGLKPKFIGKGSMMFNTQ